MSALIEHERQDVATRAIELTPIGVRVFPGAEKSALREEAQRLLYLANMAPLYSADLFIYFNDAFGQADAAELIPDIGKTKHTIENWVSIARAFPLHRRVPGLEMGHYDALRSIKDKDGKALVDRQNDMAKQAAREGWTVAKTREKAKDASDRAKGKLIDVPDDGSEAQDDDRPIFDQGAAGEAMAGERGLGTERADTDGFDDIERIRRIWNKLTPDLHIRFVRSVMTADLFAQIAADFQQNTPSSSRVEPSPPTNAPREAPANTAPSGCPPSQTVGGGSQLAEPELPAFFDRRSKETVDV